VKENQEKKNIKKILWDQGKRRPIPLIRFDRPEEIEPRNVNRGVSFVIIIEIVLFIITLFLIIWFLKDT